MDGEGSTVQIQHGLPAGEDIACSRHVIRTAQDGIHLRCQHSWVNGFGNEVVAAHVHRHDDVEVIRRARKVDNWHAGDAAQLLRPVMTVEEGEHQIHQYDLRLPLGELLRHMAEIADFLHLVSPRGQHLRDGISQGSVVFD